MNAKLITKTTELGCLSPNSLFVYDGKVWTTFTFDKHENQYLCECLSEKQEKNILLSAYEEVELILTVDLI